MVALKNVAAHAGAPIATVLHALDTPRFVLRETSERIAQSIQVLPKDAMAT